MYHVLIDGLVAVSPLVLQKTRPCNVDIFCGGEEAPQVRRPRPGCAPILSSKTMGMESRNDGWLWEMGW